MLNNSTIVCVECVCNQVTVDEEFKVLLEYVEHQFLGKIVVGLKVTWKEIRLQKIDEYVKKKMQDWEANTVLQMEQIT